MNETLSRIVAELFVKSTGGEELSSKINLLRVEIKKVIESDGTIFGKFRELVESFQEIIPEEKQRYNAAIKALSTTSRLSRQVIVQAVNNQLEELKILEKGLMPALPVWRDELKAMEAKAKEMRDEISKLRERIVWLENEEKGIFNGMSERQKEMELAEKAMKELFTGLGAEITYIKTKVEEFTAETAAPQPHPQGDVSKGVVPGKVEEVTAASAAAQPIPQGDPLKIDIPGEKKEGGEQKIEMVEPSEQQDTEFQKKCPMCGGRMDFLSHENMWQCYSCGYEDLEKEEVQSKSEKKSEDTNAPEPTPDSASIVDFSSKALQETKKQSSRSNEQPTQKKTCPACRKKMLFYPSDKTWRCSFCEYERRI